MNIKKIKALEEKVNKQAQKAVDAIYKKHSKKMVSLIAEQLPKGKTLVSGNGLVFFNGEIEGQSGKGWGLPTEYPDLDYLATLQYSSKFRGNFNLSTKIRSKAK